MIIKIKGNQEKKTVFFVMENNVSEYRNKLVIMIDGHFMEIETEELYRSVKLLRDLYQESEGRGLGRDIYGSFK